MESLFDKPQRQSAIGVLVLFFDTFYQYGKAFGPLLLVYLVKSNHISKLAIFMSLFGVILIISMIAYLKYLNFTFFLDHDKKEFVIREGILNKTSTTVQLQKIQQVNITQNLLQRLINVYTLQVDTAGNNETEAKIKAISHDLALELKMALLQNESASVRDSISEFSSEIISEKQQPFIKISFLSLFKMGITSNYIRSFSLLMLFFFTLLDYMEKFFGEDLYSHSQFKRYFRFDGILQSLFIAIFFFVLLMIVINLSRIVIKYFDYTINKQQGSLIVNYGLINTNSTIIKPEKVQIISISKNYFQKKLDVLELKIKQAIQGEKGDRHATIEIPGCNESEKNEILNLILQKTINSDVMLRPNFRKLVFALFLSVFLPVLIYVSIRARVGNFEPHYDYFLLAYIVFVSIFHFFRFRNSRLFINDDFIVFQSGAWDICKEIIEPNRIQAITTSQLFWHKPLNIGSITLHTAGGNLAFQLGDYNKIKQYVNLWLYQLEKSDSNWM
jgi:putative membrane protein